MAETPFNKLSSILDAQISRFDLEAKKHKMQYQWFRRWAIILTALSTILAGCGAMFDGIGDKVVDASIVAVTAITAAVVSYEGIRKPAELWAIERNVFHALNDLKRELEFLGEERAKDDRLDDIFSRLQSVLQSAQGKWRGVAAKPASQNGEQDAPSNGE